MIRSYHVVVQSYQNGSKGGNTAGKIGHFRSDEARSRFYELYDRAVEELWPVPAENLEVKTRFGSTHVLRSGTGDAQGSPLVLFPGNSGTSVGWYTIVKPLA